MKRLLYIIGIPGAGKTTLLALTLVGIPSIGQANRPVPHIVYPGGCQLGKVDAWYSREGPIKRRSGGTDSSSMSVQPRILTWLGGSCAYNNVLAEGDRLANLSFFQGVQAADWELTVVHLDTPETIALDRCVKRGSTQSRIWWNGRVTKVHNLVSNLLATMPVINLDGTLPLDILAAQLAAYPAVRELSKP